MQINEDESTDTSQFIVKIGQSKSRPNGHAEVLLLYGVRRGFERAYK